MADALEQKLQKLLGDLELYELYIKKDKALEDYLFISAETNDSKKVVSYKFNPITGSIKIIPFFDLHYGLKGCNVPKLESYTDLILRNDNFYTFLGGDTCETATKDSVGLAMQEEELHTGDQRRKLTDLLRPLAEEGKILCGFPGNHEMRGHQFNGDNPLIEICYDLEVPYCGYQAYLNIDVNDVNYHIVGWHGKGGGTTMGGKINSASKMKNVAVADLYVSGHSHTRATWDESIFEIVGDTVEKRRTVFVIGGSLVNYFDLYSEQKALSPGVTGLVLISLNGEKKYVSVTL